MTPPYSPARCPITRSPIPAHDHDSGSAVRHFDRGGTGTIRDQTIQISGPVVTTHDTRVTAGHGVAVSSLFSVTDLNGAAITEYQLWDSNPDPSSGYFARNGVHPAGRTRSSRSPRRNCPRTPSSSRHRASTVCRSAPLTATAGAPPTMRPGRHSCRSRHRQPAGGDHHRQIGFTRTDPGPVEPVYGQRCRWRSPSPRYQLWDSNRDPNSGYFTINGVKQDAGTIINILASDLANTAFVTGKVSDTLQIRAFDSYRLECGGKRALGAVHGFSAGGQCPGCDDKRPQHGGWADAFASQAWSLSTTADGDTITAISALGFHQRSQCRPFGGQWRGAGGRAGDQHHRRTDGPKLLLSPASVGDQLQIRASDGVLWSAADNASWAPFTVTRRQSAPW